MASKSKSPQRLASQSPSPTPISLQKPKHKKDHSQSIALIRRFRSIFRSFPIISPACKIPISLSCHYPGTNNLADTRIPGATRLTGTLFGHKNGRINLSFQQSPKTLPTLVLELAIPTGKLLQDMGLGLVRIALECEKRKIEEKKKMKLIEEPIWTMYCNGNKIGYGVRRDASEEDLGVMQWLHPVSMGAGVLPSETPLLNNGDGGGELMYMRACFERVVGSKDSETYYMVNVDGNSGPELSIFFVRV